MVNPVRIQEYRFNSGLTLSAATTSVLYTDYVINGEILQVEWAANRTGSLAITPSGLPLQDVWHNNAPSGTGIQIAYPYVFPQTSTGSIANSTMVPFVVNDVLALTLTGVASGTQPYTVTLKYRG